MSVTPADSDAWNVAHGKDPEKPSILRYRPNLSGTVGDPSYSKRLTIIWPYGGDNDSGMPNEEQSAALKKFEDTMIEALDATGLAILTFVFTSAGQREWHFYISDVDEVGHAVNEALVGQPVLPIELGVEEDPGWSVFRQVLRGCGHGES